MTLIRFLNVCLFFVPLSPIVWNDLRTSTTVHQLLQKCPNQDKFHFAEKAGLPIVTYFSAVKYRWILDHAGNPDIADALAKGTLRFGTIDTWLIWNLTGGPNGGVFVTDVTNASRTLLMNIRTLAWDLELCHFFGISPATLPEIRSSSEVYGHFAHGSLKGIAIAGVCLSLSLSFTAALSESLFFFPSTVRR